MVTRYNLGAALAATALSPMPAAAQMVMDQAHPMPMATPTPAPATPAMPRMTMDAAPAPYAPGSGTARNPGGEGAMHGIHLPAGKWMLMLHGYALGVVTDQHGPRGASKAFVATMAMLEGRRDLGGAALTLRSMLSLEPLMGPRGYPSLFATGETADGVTPLIDRQHPHDLVMELSARLDVPTGGGVTGFVYGGPVAEPALGPSAFLHRASATYLPLAPISHHWFDSTHISYGVVTLGAGGDRWQLEASAFRGREPDEHRWDIETPALDSWSVRATWTPSPRWAVQASHGRLHEPEALEPGLDEARTTASVQYGDGRLSGLVAFSAKNRVPGRTLTAWLVEGNWAPGDHHTLFGRAESVANDELIPDPADPRHDRAYRVRRAEAGYAYRLRLGDGSFGLAIGASALATARPDALDSAYGCNAWGWTTFARLSVGH